jgi:hypothetical protein
MNESPADSPDRDTSDRHRRDVNAAADMFELRIPADIRELGPMRRRLRAWLDRHSTPEPTSTDVVLAASELAAAAMRAAPAPDATVAMRAWPERDGIVVESGAEVQSDGIVGGHSLFDGNEGERAFSVVASLSDVFGVRDAPHGVIVRARLARRFGTISPG